MYKVTHTKETSKYATVICTMAQCHFCSFLEINSTRNEKKMVFEICLYKTSVRLHIFFKLLVTVLKSSPLSNLISNFS